MGLAVPAAQVVQLQGLSQFAAQPQSPVRLSHCEIQASYPTKSAAFWTLLTVAVHAVDVPICGSGAISWHHAAPDPPQLWYVFIRITGPPQLAVPDVPVHLHAPEDWPGFVTGPSQPSCASMILTVKAAIAKITTVVFNVFII